MEILVELKNKLVKKSYISKIQDDKWGQMERNKHLEVFVNPQDGCHYVD